MVAIPETGDLRETPLPQLLLDLYRGRFDGQLRLVRGHAEKTFLLQGGVPVFAESNLASESLGIQLLDSGRISRKDHTRVSRHVEQKQCKEGTALLELGVLDARSLFVALKEQVRLRIIDCFGWPSGNYHVDPSDAPSDKAQPFRADVYPLIQEGIRTHWSSDRILTDLTDHMDALVARNRRLSRIQDRLQWDEALQAFIDALDGQHTLWQALQRVQSPSALAGAWVLATTGAIDYRDPAIASSAAPEVEIVLTEEARPSPGPATAGPGHDPSPGTGVDAVLLQEILDKSERLDTLDHYALLGVESHTPPDEIRRAYLEAAKRFHPDALGRAGVEDDTRARAGRVFAAIGRAHAVLSNTGRRREYDAHRDLDESDLDAERLAAAETNFRKAEILLRQGNFRGALEYLKPAVDLWPDEPAYQAALGWALFKKSPAEPEAARDHLERAHELEPRNAQTAHHLSIVHRSLGDEAQADRLLTAARAIDPDVG